MYLCCYRQRYVVSTRVHGKWIRWECGPKSTCFSYCCYDRLSHVHIWWEVRREEVSSTLQFWSIPVAWLLSLIKFAYSYVNLIFRLGDFWVLDTGKLLWLPLWAIWANGGKPTRRFSIDSSWSQIFGSGLNLPHLATCLHLGILQLLRLLETVKLWCKCLYFLLADYWVVSLVIQIILIRCRYGGWDGKKWLSDVYVLDTSNNLCFMWWKFCCFLY